MEKVSDYPKGIGLENNFRNFILEKKKVTDFLIASYISHKCGIKTFLKWSINKCPKGTY